MFADDRVFVVRSQLRPGRRAFPVRANSLSAVTLGQGVVVSCDEFYYDWALENLPSLSREEVFAAGTVARLVEIAAACGQRIAGPTLKTVCTPDSFQMCAPPSCIALERFRGDEIRALYEHAGFTNALSYDPSSPRPDVIAVAAKEGAQIVGIAGVSADCDTLWQVGIDVLVTHRNRGIAKALVAAATELVFDADRIPYSASAISNLPSARTLAAVGYWPAWTELYSY
jgi:GNAT superfamily N-acetyltransferase